VIVYEMSRPWDDWTFSIAPHEMRALFPSWGESLIAATCTYVNCIAAWGQS
jgi:hypothetical protein